MSTSTAAAPATGGLGGWNPTYQRIELRRMIRNPWTIGFSAVMPVALYLLFGAGPDYGRMPLAHGNVTGLIALNMALYGAMMAATSVAATVSEERANGWNRQLHLTPLRATTYVGSKLVNALVVGLLVVVVTLGVAAVTGARLDPLTWMLAGALVWIGGTLVFAAFGLAVGYLFTGEAVLGVVGPLMSVFGFFGGLFIPVDQLGGFMQTFAPYTPMYGLRVLVERLVTDGPVGHAPVVNVTLWTAVFVVVAVWRYRVVTGRE